MSEEQRPPPQETQSNAEPALEQPTPALSEKISGTVARWRNDKGFGFLTPDKGGEDVFVHQSEIRVEGDGYRNLTEGDKVEFEIRQESDGRTKAYNVTAPGGAPVQGVWGNETPQRGRVAKWNADKGFGFIAPEAGGDDIFVHQSCILSSGFRSLSEGEEIEYSVIEENGRPKASKVTGPGGRPVAGGKGDGKGGKGDFGGGYGGGGDRGGYGGGGDRGGYGGGGYSDRPNYSAGGSYGGGDRGGYGGGSSYGGSSGYGGGSYGGSAPSGGYGGGSSYGGAPSGGSYGGSSGYPDRRESGRSDRRDAPY